MLQTQTLITKTGRRSDRVQVAGKFFSVGENKWLVSGLSYGPFAPNTNGEPLPEPDRARQDMELMQRLKVNAIRVYNPPPVWLLDVAVEHGIRVFIDVPWEKHRCFFEDWSAQQTARNRVRTVARDLANHPGVFAISVVNEIPTDIVRFYGRGRVERFVDELVDSVKSIAPECLCTFVNFPPTEYLAPKLTDFCCFNVYLHDREALDRYLMRLQHLAGNSPLLLGEFGADSIRHGEDGQSELLTEHLESVDENGLAGAFVFSYTDDWFTGGYQIEDWAFGIVRRDRSLKEAAHRLAKYWSAQCKIQSEEWPKVSVVVCTYNGHRTLNEALQSLMELDYPEYEVIVVDDGSGGEVRRIAERFPEVIYVRQRNRGLSAARNVGAATAVGEIVAYTDDDCVAGATWLRHLVHGMLKHNLDAAGGPNITPPTDSEVAKFVALCPGNPSHVMVDDAQAEHVPGCNMAFRRSTLINLGGFDQQFRQAGDDVDVCWRLLDANLRIGYVPGAMVWHHRRSTVAAFRKQQKGYGRAEAMLSFKHPLRYGVWGRPIWKGVIYGDSVSQSPFMRDVVYHGQFGFGLFQTIYRQSSYGALSCSLSLEWHVLALFALLLGTIVPAIALLAGVMWAVTLGVCVATALRPTLPRGAPWWSRLLLMYLNLMQPLVRGWYRTTYLLQQKRLPQSRRRSRRARRALQDEYRTLRSRINRVSPHEHDLYWSSSGGSGREALLQCLVQRARESGWWGDFDNAWADWDVKLVGDRWHDIEVRTATEELGESLRFTRARSILRRTAFHRVCAAASIVWTGVALAAQFVPAMLIGAAGCTALLFASVRSRSRCAQAVLHLVSQAGATAGLTACDAQGVEIGADSETIDTIDRMQTSTRVPCP